MSLVLTHFSIFKGMRNLLQFIICFFLTYGLVASVNGQNFLSASGKVIVNEAQDTVLLRGMGLGGWMLQEGYMLQTAGFANSQRKIRAEIEALIGEADTDLFYEAWYANHMRLADVEALKSWGFNAVRLPMHYNLFTLPIEDEPVPGEHTWLDKGFEMTDSLIAWCAQNEMYVILDLHAAPGGQGYDEGISDYDPSKPSLWESSANQAKTVALWERLAERYADEQWVAGYDLLNEPNWDLPGNTSLRNLYEDITEAIRAVDANHIIFIEGNWFANDFTGLTPPWDPNLVYSPHKYWSFNDPASIQWVLDIRNNYNVPLFLGESGENSNVWFADAIRLLEDFDIGWAWWPLKKVESISCALSITKSSDYQSLLDYWNNGGQTPDTLFVKQTLMQLTEDLKMENCDFQPEVIDAMFRQVHSEETVPYTNHMIPGVVHATDYDMGIIGEAYFDEVSANYNVSTGEYTSWNDGWAYRNDGVDIEFCSDDINSNGFNVGFTATDEWMQYEVDVEASGVYHIAVRTSSGGSGGRFHFKADGAELIPTTFAPPTGNWQSWTTVLVENVILDESDEKLQFYIDQAGFNVSSFEFIETGLESNSLPTTFINGETIDEYHIQMNANKLLQGPVEDYVDLFELTVNGELRTINQITLNDENPRIINFELADLLIYSDDIRLTYTGEDVAAIDETTLNTFILEPIENRLEFVHVIPGRIEAEAFSEQSGIELEETTDVGGGENIGYLDPFDYMDYEVYVPAGGNYRLDVRHAAQYGTAQLKIVFIDSNGSVYLIDQPTFSSTGGWQSWQTSSVDVLLPAGRYTMRVTVYAGPLNVNWFEFNYPTSVVKVLDQNKGAIHAFPNPSNGAVQVQLNAHLPFDLLVFDARGRMVHNMSITDAIPFDQTLFLKDYGKGLFLIQVVFDDGQILSRRIIIE